MNWFYEAAGQQQGPVPEHELDRLIAEGKVTPNTLVWSEGMADWQPLRIARPGETTPPPLSAVGSGDVPPGFVRCSATGKILPESEAVFVGGKPYAPEARPGTQPVIGAGASQPL